MLYSIGYQKITVDQLLEILKKHNIEFLLDVRSKPYSRKYQFNKKALTAILKKHSISYTWAGETLGGFTKIRGSAIRRLSKWQSNKTACLMCMEADPEQCHRHYEIAVRLTRYGVTVNHILTGTA